jgi:hypothetical protein
MPDTDGQSDTIDWSLTTWEGARREQLRRWADLTLEEVIRAQEEMRELAATAATTPPLPASSEDYLAGLSLRELIELLIADEDRVPRNVIDECARRGDTMVEHLDALLRDDNFWRQGAPLGEWWLRLHAVMILGLIPGERAGLLLVECMHRMARVDDESLQDWLAAYWPALFRNKPEAVVPALRAMAQERALDWYIRTGALDAAVSVAELRGSAALEEALAWSAAIAGDEAEDQDMRLCAANRLLDFPRDAYRPLLEELAGREAELAPLFCKTDVEKAYSAMEDKPDWERFGDPWEFYTAVAIQRRHERWKKEAALEDERALEDDDTPDDFMIPYVRETPKVGRNDPCPCGSGKKYKKCCLSP